MQTVKYNWSRDLLHMMIGNVRGIRVLGQMTAVANVEIRHLVAAETARMTEINHAQPEELRHCYHATGKHSQKNIFIGLCMSCALVWKS